VPATFLYARAPELQEHAVANRSQIWAYPRGDVLARSDWNSNPISLPENTPVEIRHWWHGARWWSRSRHAGRRLCKSRDRGTCHRAGCRQDDPRLPRRCPWMYRSCACFRSKK